MNNIEFYKPKNPILQQFIKGYYFYRENKYSIPLNHLVFPSNYCYLTLLKRAELKVTENKMLILPTVKNKISMNIIPRYDSPLEFCYEKKVDEITVVFKPLGINHFIQDSDITLSEKVIFDMIFPDIQTKMEEVFACDNIEKQQNLVEDYWLSKLTSPSLKVSTSLLNDIQNNMPIQSIAEKYGMTRQYLHKLFLKEIGKSPSEFKSVGRFRKSLQQRKSGQSLSEIAYQYNYSDQAHFNKEFKKYTGFTPSHVFKKGNSHVKNPWLVL